MKAIVRETYGSPDVLHLEEVPVPALRDDDVLVRVRGASANSGDWHLIRGTALPFRLVAGLRIPKFKDHRHRARRSCRSSRPERHRVPSGRRSIRELSGCGSVRVRNWRLPGEGAGVEAGERVLRGGGDVTNRRLHGASGSSEGIDITRTAGLINGTGKAAARDWPPIPAQRGLLRSPLYRGRTRTREGRRRGLTTRTARSEG